MTVLPEVDDPLNEVTQAVYDLLICNTNPTITDIHLAIGPPLRELQQEIAQARCDFIALGQLCSLISERVDDECDEVEAEAFALNQSEVREFVLKIREIVCGDES